MKGQKKDAGSSAGRIADARFASFETDPRFRLPSKKRTKTTLDKRFAGMLKDDEFTATARVDRYGRKVKSDAKKKALQRLYQAEDDEDDEDESDEAAQVEVDDDELVQRELREAHEKSKQRKHDPARDGGFSSSESESESDSDDSDDEDEAAADTEGDMQRFQDDQADVESGEVTNRIAIVNLDWDHVKSTDLMALFSSFIPPNAGRILSISIYPSEFGKERMQQEELEGPPKELFKNDGKEGSDSSDDDASESDSDSDSDSGDEKIKKELMKEGNDQDFDSDALRSYQLDRLRYYYAVMVCSSPETAQKIYESTDGTEYQSSSNVIDLRFVPDDVTFDDEPRDSCDKVPGSYKPVEFVTNALQSSKVKLTWDMHPEEASRKDALKRAFSGSRTEIEENDLRAYLASDTEDDEEEEETPVQGDGDDDADVADEPKLSKKELARKKMREALGLSDEPATKASKDGPVGEMQITFAPALAESKAKEADKEETTIEKYKRKEKERKERKRQAAKDRREGAADDKVDDDKGDRVDAGDELGFDDPFFTTEESAPVSKSSIRKEERLKKRQAREAAEAESAQQKAQLTKVMAEGAGDGEADHLDHFDMNEIVRAEKKKGKKSKKAKGKGAEERGGLQEDFAMDVGDDRFKAVFDSHEFAIDPSNPKFKATGGMKQLLEEGRKKRKAGGDGDGGERGGKKSKKNRR
ncbi:pre-rRNA processing protein Esf1 [Purpureocillium lavendulum]|uniref:Pre-rRNA processing protein Esf1 n=1 Tax=Purpureocillium lavendulum TaxID=1247861 RepID=A0AB34G0L6_9HYPO|nr:pre-rRNA processing protein Esf1 [Purpureocillium lavendulum]